MHASTLLFTTCVTFLSRPPFRQIAMTFGTPAPCGSPYARNVITFNPLDSHPNKFAPGRLSKTVAWASAHFGAPRSLPSSFFSPPIHAHGRIRGSSLRLEVSLSHSSIVWGPSRRREIAIVSGFVVAPLQTLTPCKNCRNRSSMEGLYYTRLWGPRSFLSSSE